ncbi:hypothetical protein [Treponema endosymbiont of Eucomonympha sp.]|uniref:hypothetical protein n=1 Tax=Treponema endosymbiont of Eucomonympha sp. TaxID=1580831 RepID=UPI000A96CC5C|nr:hypothetical protein [Treponema endosymbiont of Eucomonympha sp.]
MNSNDEGNGELCVARSDSSLTFEGAEDDFNEISVACCGYFIHASHFISSALVHTT